MKIVYLLGGSGYIGSTITYLLHESGYRVINLDLVNWNSPMIDALSHVTWYPTNVEDWMDLSETYKQLILDNHGDENFGLIHLAAWKDLPGSYQNPFEYYRNNIQGSINASQLAHMLGCKTMIFSSSAGVYADDAVGAVDESYSTDCGSPYGYSKVVGERIISDICRQYNINSYCLRYCNPIGTFEGVSVDNSDSMFGNILNHLDDGKFTIFGNDWDTQDGTCIRDYIDIRDIAKAHIHFLNLSNPFIVNDIVNVGTGKGVSCKLACDTVKTIYPKFTYNFGPSRTGDAAGSYADITKLSKYGFKCKYSLSDSIKSLIDYHLRNH